MIHREQRLAGMIQRGMGWICSTARDCLVHLVHAIQESKLKKIIPNKAYLYLLPMIIFLGVFTVYPIINTFFLSFLGDYNLLNGSHNGFTFKEYVKVLQDKEFKTAIFNTFVLT